MSPLLWTPPTPGDCRHGEPASTCPICHPDHSRLDEPAVRVLLVLLLAALLVTHSLANFPIYDTVVCDDGARLSVQASRTFWCVPRNDVGPYSAVEVLVLASGVCWVAAALYDTRRIGAAMAAGAVVASWVGIGWLAWRAL